MFKPKTHLMQFSTAGVASFVATAIDGLMFAQLLVWARAFGLAEMVGVVAAVAALLGGMTHFMLCRYWVFQHHERPLPEAIAAYVVMSLGAALAHGVTTHLLTMYGGATLGWLTSKALIFALWTYPVSRFVVFGRVSQSSK
jgi:putative flippase GtrA